MKIFIAIMSLIFLMIILNIVNYNYFLVMLSIIWYAVSILFIYSAFKFSTKYKFIQYKIGSFLKVIKSKSKNNITPLSSLCMSLAAKIGVGSLAGVSLAIYLGGVGSVLWMCVISLFLSINTYIECIFGVKFRDKINGIFNGGPSVYIRKCLNNKYISILYSVLVIVTYSGFFMSIQSNTIISVFTGFNINKILIVLVLVFCFYLVIRKNSYNIFKINLILVPIMLGIYIVLGLYVILNNNVLEVLLDMVESAFNLKSIIPVFLIGMQRAVFISESGLGTSAISAASCDNTPHNQGMLEVMGIYITTFCICFITFIIIATSNYGSINYVNINGIEILMDAFYYHFGILGKFLLSLITILFAFSTIISGYFFGDSNLKGIVNNKLVIRIFKYLVILVIIISSFVSSSILWNLTDFFIAILAIINISAMLKIDKKSKL